MENPLRTLQTVASILQPVTTGQRLSLRCNAAILQNQGNCDILLDGGFTLEPGQSLELGNESELNVISIDWTVMFLAATATSLPVVQRLEVVQILAKMLDANYYIDKPPIKTK